LIGQQSGSPTKLYAISYGGDGNNYYYYGLETDGITTTSSFTTGYSVISTTGSSFQNLYRNGLLVKANSGSATGTSTHEAYIGALNNSGTPIQYTPSRFAFASMGSGFTESEILTLSTIVNTFQESLGRNVYSTGLPEANTYLSAVVAAGGTVDSTMSAATRTLFQSIWSNGLNTSMVAMYPFIGGTAASHAVQGMSPGTYNLTFNGGWTQNVSGATPNGTNAYANTSVVPSTPGFTLSGGSVGVYCGTDASTGCAVGSTGTANGALALFPVLLNPTKQIATTFWNNTVGAYSVTTVPDALGLISIARSGSTSTVQFYRRGGFVSSQNHSALSLSNVSTYLGANNQFNTTINNYSTYRQQFTYLYGGTLTTSQMSTLNDIIQTYQTSLGRNTY
jgi:hypothetical protein